MGPPGTVVSKLYAYSDKNPLITIENVYCSCDHDRGQTDIVDVGWLGLQQMYVHL